MRNKILLLALSLLTMVGVSNAFAGSGGPDIYGYTWQDSDEPGGPAYVWNSITGTAGATQIMGLADDNAVGPFTLNGWSFHYYWSDVNTWKFGSNGWVGFNNIGNIASCFPLIPTQGGSGDNYVAPYMSDLIFGNGIPGEVWYYDNGADTLVIEWTNVPWWQAAAPGYVGVNTFQLILSGQDSSITFMYNDVDQANWPDNAGCNADMEIGIENITGNIGLEVFNETVPADSFAVKFYYPAVVTFQVPDATPAWNANADNAGQFYLAGASANVQDMIANVSNVGNADITNTINIEGELDAGGTQFWTSLTDIPSLNAGANMNVTFPDQVTFTTPDVHYSYTVETTNSQDINPSNNINTVEVIASECTGDSMNLNYSEGAQPDGVCGWSGGGGNEGGGIYVVPPVYPATITSVDVYIFDVGQDPGVCDGFGVAIYDDSGMPGALLDSAGMAANTPLENAYNRVRFPTGATITSGGFYIGWFQGGTNVALGTETLAPISKRTFEILGGSWSPYRQITVDDFMISVHVNTTCPAVGLQDVVPSSLNLRAVPNPSNGLSNINFDLASAGDVKLTVVNMFGQIVYSRTDADLAAGSQTMRFEGQDLAAGVYYINIETATEKAATKMVISR